MNATFINLTLEFLINYVLHSTVVFATVAGVLALLKRTHFPELRVLALKAAIVLPVLTTLVVTAGV